MSEYQEEVLTNLLDLQAELRGDEPQPHDEQSNEASLDLSTAADRPRAGSPLPSPKAD